MKWCWLPFVIVACFSALGQNSINSAPDTTRRDTTYVDHLLLQSKKYQWIDSYKSLNYADQALLAANQLGYKKGIAAASNLKGFCFWTFGDNDLAIQFAMEAMTVARNENDLLNLADSYYIQARGYMDLREGEKSKELIRKAETLAIEVGSGEQLSRIYNLKGVILFIANKEDSARYYYNLAYEIGKGHAVDPINFPRIIANIGECYETENMDLAFSHYTRALALAKETGNKIAEASITSIIGHAYLDKKDFRDAEINLQSALQMAQALGLRRVIRQAYGGLVDIKLLQGKGNEAVVYLRRYYAVRDSLLGASKIRQIVELEGKHELQLKEQSIKLLESEKHIASLWRNLLTVALILLILLSFGLYQLQKYRYRKNHDFLNLEIDYLTQQHKEAVGRYNTLYVQEPEASIESYDQKLLKKAISIVETHLGDPQLSVEKMALEMNMSRTSLHRKIKSITGFPPSELIRSIRLRKAARLILGRVDSASQIALTVGFEDYSHFSKAFKKHFGVSPSSYGEQSKLEQQLLNQESDGTAK